MLTMPARRAAAFFACMALSAAPLALEAFGQGRRGKPSAIAASAASVSGKAEIMDSGGSWVRLRQGEKLREGDQIRTAPGSEVVIAFSEGTTMRLGQQSQFTLESRAARKIEVRLILGMLDSWVSKLRGRTVAVRTASAVASVRGTNFRCLSDSAGRATFELFSGRLDVSDSFGRTMPLVSGHRLTSNKDSGIGQTNPEPLPQGADMGNKPKVATPEPETAEAPKDQNSGEDAQDEAAQEEQQAADDKEVDLAGPGSNDQPPPPNPKQDIDTLSPSTP